MKLPSSEQILDEHVAETVRHIRAGDSEQFIDALRELTDFHAFLAKGYGDFSRLSYGWKNFHSHWTERAYRKLSVQVGRHLDEDMKFLSHASYVPNMFISNTKGQVSPDVWTDVLVVPLILLFRALDWWEGKVTTESDPHLTFIDRRALGGYAGKEYDRAIRDFIGHWEGLTMLTPLYFEWREYDRPETRWNAFQNTKQFIRTHLDNSVYMTLGITNRGDYKTACLMTDALLKWHHWSRYNLDRRSYIGSPIASWDLLDVDCDTAHRKAAYPDGRLSPDDIFASILKNMHFDTLIVALCVLIVWMSRAAKPMDDNGAQTTAAIIARRLFAGETDEKDSAGEYEPLGFTTCRANDLIIHYLRQHTSWRRDGGYAGWLDRMVQQLDALTERDVIPGRGYSPETMFEVRELLLGQLVLLAAVVAQNREFHAGIDESTKRCLDAIAQERTSYDSAVIFFRDALSFMGTLKDRRWLSVFAVLLDAPDETENYGRSLEGVFTLISQASDYLNALPPPPRQEA